MATTQTSFAGGVTLLSSTLDDATATQLGLKQYLHGTTYNGGNAPTVTCLQSGFSVVRAVFLPYQCQDGSWRLKFNITATYTSATISSLTVSINGTTFKNVSSHLQSCSGMTSGTNGATFMQCYANPNSGDLKYLQTSTTLCTGISLSGDFELNAKPTWAY